MNAKSCKKKLACNAIRSTEVVHMRCCGVTDGWWGMCLIKMESLLGGATSVDSVVKERCLRRDARLETAIGAGAGVLEFAKRICRPKSVANACLMFCRFVNV